MFYFEESVDMASVIFVASYLKRLLCIKRFSFQQMTLLWSSSFCCLLQRLNDDYRTIIITFVIFPSLTVHPYYSELQRMNWAWHGVKWKKVYGVDIMCRALCKKRKIISLYFRFYLFFIHKCQSLNLEKIWFSRTR